MAMLECFWNEHFAVLIFYLQQNKTITGEYYASQQNHLQKAMKAKSSHLANK